MSNGHNTHRPGDYLVVDDLTGEWCWASDCQVDWDGSFRHVNNIDGKHPSYDYRKLPREKYPKRTSVPEIDTTYSNTKPTYVGNTTIPMPESPVDCILD
jgi:hypothetical protein